MNLIYRKREVMELCQIACEKFAAAEKTPYERDNQAAATMIKVRLILSKSFTAPTSFYTNIIFIWPTSVFWIIHQYYNFQIFHLFECTS